MIRTFLTLYFSIGSPNVDARHEALVCDVAICCDSCTPQGESFYCRGCSGSGSGSCETGQTSLACPPGTCYGGNAKLNYGTWGNNACK